MKNKLIYQDNESAIKMEVNGRNSCTGNSRHVNIKYFWVKDHIDKGVVRIKYCPTTLMLADYFTKPLQGELFRRLRAVIIGHKDINDLLSDPKFSLKESAKKMNIVIENSIRTKGPATLNPNPANTDLQITTRTAKNHALNSSH